METRSRTWLARNVRQVWDGGVSRMLGLEFLAARSRLFQDGMGLGPIKASEARHRPTPRRREHAAPEGEDDHQGRRARYGTGLIGLKNLRGRPQKPEGVASTS
jgi:hypothetical protein